MSAALDMLNVLHEPSAVFTRVKERPRVLVPWLILSVLLIGGAYALRPYAAAAIEGLRASLPPEQAARMAGAGGRSLLQVFLGPPLQVIVALAIGAGLLWVGVLLVGGKARYKTLMSVLAYSFITFVIFQALTTAVLMLRGVGAVSSLQDLRAPLGLDLLVPGASVLVGALLNGINPLSIWGVWLCGTGISITHETSRTSGILVAACAFLIGLLLYSVLVSLPLLLMGAAARQ